ncbi:MAG: hypothetical protein ABIH66_07300 [bacterium]
MNRFQSPFFLLCILCALSAPAASFCAPGALSMFSNEGKHLFTQKLFNRTGNPADITRPLNLLQENERVLRIDSIYEDIHRLEKNGVRVSSVSSRGKKVFFLYPFEKDAGKGATVAAFDRYGATLRFFSNDSIDNTNAIIRESGSALSLARKSGRLLVGVHRGTSAIRGGGVSEEINNRADILSSDAETSLSLKEQRRVWAVGYRIGKYEMAWQDNRFRMPMALSVSDSDTEFRLPLESRGSSHEGSMSARLSPSRRIKAFYGEGEGNSFDINRYYVSNPAIDKKFRNLSNSKFRNWGIGAVGKISKNNSLRVELEDYRGNLFSAGVLDYTTDLSGLFGTDYNLRVKGDIHFSVLRFHILRTGSRFSKALSYSLMPFNADFRFSSCEINAWCVAPEKTEEYHFRDSRIHTLSLGLKMKIGRGKSLEYSITQVVPQVNRVEEPAPAAPPQPAEPAAPETKKERGGTTHFLSLEFRF